MCQFPWIQIQKIYLRCLWGQSTGLVTLIALCFSPGEVSNQSIYWLISLSSCVIWSRASAVFEAGKRLMVQIKCTGRELTSNLCCPCGCFCVCRVHHPGICPPWTLWDRPLQPARARLEFPVLRQRQHSDLAADASKSHCPSWLFIASYLAPSPLWPLPHPLITAWVRADSEPPLQRGGFRSRPSLHLCIKGQITLSDVIFLWVMAAEWAGWHRWPPWVTCEAVWKDMD